MRFHGHIKRGNVRLVLSRDVHIGRRSSNPSRRYATFVSSAMRRGGIACPASTGLRGGVIHGILSIMGSLKLPLHRDCAFILGGVCHSRHFHGRPGGHNGTLGTSGQLHAVTKELIERLEHGLGRGRNCSSLLSLFRQILSRGHGSPKGVCSLRRPRIRYVDGKGRRGGCRFNGGISVIHSVANIVLNTGSFQGRCSKRAVRRSLERIRHVAKGGVEGLTKSEKCEKGGRINNAKVLVPSIPGEGSDCCAHGGGRGLFYGHTKVRPAVKRLGSSFHLKHGFCGNIFKSIIGLLLTTTTCGFGETVEIL